MCLLFVHMCWFMQTCVCSAIFSSVETVLKVYFVQAVKSGMCALCYELRIESLIITLFSVGEG